LPPPLTGAEAVPPAPPPSSGETALTGRALLESGGDPGGILVRLARYRARGDTAGTPNWFETETAPDGTFRVGGILPGRYGLVARREGLPPKRLEVEVPEGGRFVELLYESTGILVRVRGRGPGLRVTIAGGRETLREGGTDAHGEVLFAGVEPGRYTVRLERRSRELHPRHRLVRAEAGRTVVVDFGGEGRLFGTVRGPDGTLLGASIVHAMNRFGDGRRWSASCRADSRGRFEIDAVPTGEYDVTVQLLGPRMCVAPATRVTLGPGEARELDLGIADTRISGTVTRAATGEGLKTGQAELSATPVDPERPDEPAGWPLLGSTDLLGRFELRGLAPGAYLLRVSAPWEPLEERRIVAVLPENGRLDDVEIALEPRRP
jgi:hypothetical protein